MNYLVKLIFQTKKTIIVAPLFDEQLRLIVAPNKLSALITAHEIGKKENTVKEGFSFTFIAVSEIWELKENLSGEVLYNTSPIEPEPEEYIKFVKQKALFIKNKLTINTQTALHENYSLNE